MIILTIRTDKPEAELGLYDDYRQLNYLSWQAGRQLSDSLLQKIDELLAGEERLQLTDVGGIVSFRGPGSFTGLRIGLTVANALSYSQKIPIVATSDEDWIKQGQAGLLAGRNDKQALPYYGGGPHITRPRK